MEKSSLTPRQMSLLRFDDKIGHPDLDDMCFALLRMRPLDLIDKTTGPSKNLDMESLMIRMQYLEAALSEDVLVSIENSVE